MPTHKGGHDAGTCNSDKITCCSQKGTSHPLTGTKLPQNSCCMGLKLSGHTRGRHRECYSFCHCVPIVIMSLQRVPATHPCYMTCVWTTHDFVPATCRCDISLHHVPLCVGTFKCKHIPHKFNLMDANKKCFFIPHFRLQPTSELPFPVLYTK